MGPVVVTDDTKDCGRVNGLRNRRALTEDLARVSVDVDGALREADRAMYDVKPSRQRTGAGIVHFSR